MSARAFVSVPGDAYAALQERARAEGRSVSALVEALVADLPDAPELAVVPVEDDLYRRIGAIARRGHRSVASVFEAAVLAALADAEAYPPRPRRTCQRPQVAHAYRRGVA